MLNTLEIIEKIAAAPKSKDKAAIIAEYLPKDDIFQEVVRLTYSNNIAFGLKALPPQRHYRAHYNDLIFRELTSLSLKRGTTEAEAMKLSDAVGSNDQVRDLVTRIITKDLRCGASASSFNKVMPGLCYVTPYQRYKKKHADLEKIDFKNNHALGQVKMNGMFAYLKPYGLFESRNSSEFKIPGVFTDHDYRWLNDCCEGVGELLVWMGELLVLGPDGKYLDRKEGNGIINKFISGKGDPKWVESIRYVTWGYISMKDFERAASDQTYLDMLHCAQSFYDPTSRIVLSETFPLPDIEEAYKKYKQVRKRKEEGFMVKVANKLKWKDQNSGTPYGVALKPLVEAEFEIVDAYYGAKGKKNEFLLGGLTVKTSCGKLLTNIGGGYSQKERELGVPWWKEQIGKIITGSLIGVITDKSDRETMCLENSNFVETRFNEKTEADTLAYILEQLEEA